MNLTLFRVNKGQDSTIGSLWIGEGLTKYHFCETCEDEQRTEKLAGETRIPAGTYEIKKRYDSPMAKRYDANHARIGHKGMLWIQDVPNFTYCYLHKGNTDDDTDGCPSHSIDMQWRTSHEILPGCLGPEPA